MVLLLVLLAHILAWLALRPLLHDTAPEVAPRASMGWRVLMPEPAPIERSITTPAPRPGPAPTRSRPLQRPMPRQPAEAPSHAPARPTTTEAAPALPAEVEKAEPAARDLDATRRAIREAARGSGPLAQQAVEAGAALRAPTSSQRLSNEVQRAGRGDCAKGEYAGGGMGLLSLPFLAAAAIHGDCAK